MGSRTGSSYPHSGAGPYWTWLTSQGRAGSVAHSCVRRQSSWDGRGVELATGFHKESPGVPRLLLVSWLSATHARRGSQILLTSSW